MARFSGNAQFAQYNPKGLDYFLQRPMAEAKLRGEAFQTALASDLGSFAGLVEKDRVKMEGMTEYMNKNREKFLEDIMSGKNLNPSKVKNIARTFNQAKELQKTYAHALDNKAKRDKFQEKAQAMAMQTGDMDYYRNLMKKTDEGFDAVGGTWSHDGSINEYKMPETTPGRIDVIGEARKDYQVAMRDLRKTMSDAEIMRGLNNIKMEIVPVPDGSGGYTKMTKWIVPDQKYANFQAVADVRNKYINGLQNKDHRLGNYGSWMGKDWTTQTMAQISDLEKEFRRVEYKPGGNVSFSNYPAASNNGSSTSPAPYTLGNPQTADDVTFSPEKRPSYLGTKDLKGDKYRTPITKYNPATGKEEYLYTEGTMVRGFDGPEYQPGKKKTRVNFEEFSKENTKNNMQVFGSEKVDVNELQRLLDVGAGPITDANFKDLSPTEQAMYRYNTDVFSGDLSNNDYVQEIQEGIRELRALAVSNPDITMDMNYQNTTRDYDSEGNEVKKLSTAQKRDLEKANDLKTEIGEAFVNLQSERASAVGREPLTTRKIEFATNADKDRFKDEFMANLPTANIVILNKAVDGDKVTAVPVMSTQGDLTEARNARTKASNIFKGSKGDGAGSITFEAPQVINAANTAMLPEGMDPSSFDGGFLVPYLISGLGPNAAGTESGYILASNKSGIDYSPGSKQATTYSADGTKVIDRKSIAQVYRGLEFGESRLTHYGGVTVQVSKIGDGYVTSTLARSPSGNLVPLKAYRHKSINTSVDKLVGIAQAQAQQTQ